MPLNGRDRYDDLRRRMQRKIDNLEGQVTFHRERADENHRLYRAVLARNVVLAKRLPKELRGRASKP